MGKLEDGLFGAFNFTNLGGDQNSAMLILQLRMLKQLKYQIDAQILNIQARLGVKPGTAGQKVPPTGDPFSGEMNPFIILDLKQDCNKEDLDKAYRVAAKRCHPDRGGTHVEMAKINAAYETVKIMRGWN